MQAITFASIKPTKLRSPDAPLSKAVKKWQTAVSQGQVKVVSVDATKHEKTVELNGKQYVLSGFGAPPRGTLPETFSLVSADGKESIRYTGQGCFGIAKARYQSDKTDIQSHDQNLVTETMALLSAIDKL